MGGGIGLIVKRAEQTIENNHIVAGALTGAIATTAGVMAIRDSLKPFSERKIHALKEFVAGQIKGHQASLRQQSKLIADNNLIFKSYQSELDAEKKTLRQVAEDNLKKRQTEYNTSFTMLTAEIGTILGYDYYSRPVRDDNLPTYDEAVNGATPQDSAVDDVASVAALARFIAQGDNSLANQRRLLEVLEHSFSEDKIKRVKNILHSYPKPPGLKISKGPVEERCQLLQSAISNAAYNSRYHNSYIAQILKVYPMMRMDENGNVPLISDAVFADCMPE